jgi:hypothetical protein
MTDIIPIIWHLFLTVCSGSTCIEQDVQWFENKSLCEEHLVLHSEIPSDGSWDSVEYICKPVGSIAS